MITIIKEKIRDPKDYIPKIGDAFMWVGLSGIEAGPYVRTEEGCIDLGYKPPILLQNESDRTLSHGFRGGTMRPVDLEITVRGKQ